MFPRILPESWGKWQNLVCFLLAQGPGAGGSWVGCGTRGPTCTARAAPATTSFLGQRETGRSRSHAGIITGFGPGTASSQLTQKGRKSEQCVSVSSTAAAPGRSSPPRAQAALYQAPSCCQHSLWYPQVLWDQSLPLVQLRTPQEHIRGAQAILTPSLELATIPPAQHNGSGDPQLHAALPQVCRLSLSGLMWAHQHQDLVPGIS